MSEALSFNNVGLRLEDSSDPLTGVDAAEDDDFGSGFATNWLKTDGERLRVIILLCFLDLSIRPLTAGEAGMMVFARWEYSQGDRGQVSF